MSIECMTRVWKHAEQKGAPLLCLLAIADFADDNGFAWPAIPTIAKKIRMSTRHTSRILQALADSRDLCIVQRKANQSNLYIVTVGLTHESFNTAASRAQGFGGQGDILSWWGQGDILSGEHDIAMSGEGDILSGEHDIAMSSDPSLTIIKPSTTITPVTAPPSGNGDYHLIDLDEEIRGGVQVARNRVTVSCPMCQATGISQQMDKCPDCGAVIVWQGSKTWTGEYGSVKKYIRKLKGISLKPLTEYEQQFVKFFGRNHEFASEKQAADVRWLQTHKPEAMLMAQIEWGVQNKRAWQQVIAAGKNPACLNRHNARRRPGDDHPLSEAEQEQVEESKRESKRLHAEMMAAGGQAEWTRKILEGEIT